jgi:8-oxo-dGTP diphosphatase
MPKEVQTVTTFLESDGEILILLRSRHVRTFKGVWGAVSGMIDNGRNPDEQALVEIEEETGLTASDIQLSKKSEPQIIDDADRNLRKIVYPFLFHVLNRHKIRINWEHTEFKWIKPADLGDYTTMPELKETLERVLSYPTNKIPTEEL